MKYGVTLALLGIALIYLGRSADLAGWLLFWAGGSFLLVGLGYGGLGPRVFGKRADGRMAWWSVALLWPYLLLTWGLWHVQRRTTREACFHEVTPGLWLGRRPFLAEMPPGASLVVDLTAEFPASRGLAQNRDYVCVPTLDAGVPDSQALHDIIARVAGEKGGVYVHCAQGHGRSALVVMAILLAKGLARDVTEAETLVRAARPGSGLSHSQRALLEQMVKQQEAVRQ